MQRLRGARIEARRHSQGDQARLPRARQGVPSRSQPVDCCRRGVPTAHSGEGPPCTSPHRALTSSPISIPPPAPAPASSLCIAPFTQPQPAVAPTPRPPDPAPRVTGVRAAHQRQDALGADAHPWAAGQGKVTRGASGGQGQGGGGAGRGIVASGASQRRQRRVSGSTGGGAGGITGGVPCWRRRVSRGSGHRAGEGGAEGGGGRCCALGSALGGGEILGENGGLGGFGHGRVWLLAVWRVRLGRELGGR